MNEAELYDQLRSGAAVVTANTRQMTALTQAYGRHCLVQGLSVWDSPTIVPLNVWLEQLWHADEAESRFLLSAFQANTLWEQVIESDESGVAANLQTARMARLASDAWQLVHDWQLPWPLPADLVLGDAAVFGQWAQGFLERCRALGAVDSARLMPLISLAMDRRREALPDSVLFYGFEEISPAQQRLITALEAAAVQVRVIGLPSIDLSDKAIQVPCLDDSAEIVAAAQWARARLELDSQCRLAMVVPNLSQNRARLVSLLTEHLESDRATPGGSDQPSRFNLSLGQPLADQTLIQTALLILELAIKARLPASDVTVLLMSPYLGGWARESGQRAQLDLQMRRDGDPEIRLNWLLRRALDEGKIHSSPRLADALSSLRKTIESGHGEMTASRCVELFWACLKAMGWARGRKMITDEFQAVEAFRDVMARMAGLDRVLPPQSTRAWLGRLRTLIAGRTFQPRGAQAPVQVLGLMEAAGLGFDAIWVMGLDDETLPALARPSPLLPLKLQRDYQLPHSTPARELQYATRLLNHLAASADEVIVSFAQRDTEREKLASPLLSGIPARPELALIAGGLRPWRLRMWESTQIHSLKVDPAPGLQGDERIVGGTGLLTAQARCPFKAFASYRLGSVSPESPDIGLNAGERGTLAHEVLEAVWRELGDQAGLIALDEDGCRDLVRRAISECVDAQKVKRPGVFRERFSSLENQRLETLVLVWLEKERIRPPFRVLGLEASETIEVAGLPLRVRVDRLDELADGRVAIWDYKTINAPPSVQGWVGDRPDDPQLPVYAAYGSQTVDALGFAWLKTADPRFVGLADADIGIKGVNVQNRAGPYKEYDDWQAVVSEWRETIDGLGQAFRAGQAAVAPKSPGKSCAHCDHALLCRVNEVLTVVEDGDRPEVGHE